MTPEQQTTAKRVGIGLAIGVALLVAAFSAGRFSAPLQVKTVEVERWQTLDLTTTDLTRGFTFAQTVERTVFRDVVTVVTKAVPATPTTPEVPEKTTITDKTIEHEGTATAQTATEVEHKVETVTVEREKIVEKTVTLRPDWRVGVLAGASLRGPLLPIAGPLVIGVSAERRILGGVSAGIWVNTVGAAGASVSVEF